MPDKTLPSTGHTTGLEPTLGSLDYCSTTVFEHERRQVFHGGWTYVCHRSGIPAGTKRVFDVMGESVIVTADRDATLHAFANVCRHRGAELCPADGGHAASGPIRCAYHAWTYALDGALVATPRVDDEFDRHQYGLWPRHVAEWNGLVFVSLAEHPLPLDHWISTYTPTLTEWADLPVASYRIGARTESAVAANWKILVENYAECLHCAVVHPELTRLVPLYRTGNVVPPDDPSTAVAFSTGATAFTADGTSRLAPLPGVGATPTYDGAAIFPNAFFDLTPTALVLTALFPQAPDRTVVVTEYLFGAGEVGSPAFDPSAEVAFSELIGAQDYAVCEMVQRGVRSAQFHSGGLTAKDRYVAEFVARYLDVRGPLAPD